MLLSCGKTSNALTTLMVSASFHQLINCIGSETDPSFLAPLFECFSDSLKVVGGHSALALEFQTGVTDVMQQEVQTLVDKRKN
jgi:importin-5